MADSNTQGGVTEKDWKEALRLTGVLGRELDFVVANQHKDRQLIYTIEEARGPADTPSAPDFSVVATIVAQTLLDGKKANPHNVPVARSNNYRVRVKSALPTAPANYRAYCDLGADHTPLLAGDFNKILQVAPAPSYEAVGRGVRVLGTNLDQVTEVVIYDGRNPTCDPAGVRTFAAVAPYDAANIMNDSLYAYLDAADGTALMVVWPIGFTSPIVRIDLIDAGTTLDNPRYKLAPVGGITKPAPTITNVTSPKPLAIRVEGTNLGGASDLLTSRAGDPRNYDKGGWFAHFGAPLPTETAIEIWGDFGADNLDPVDTAGIRDRTTGQSTVATGLSVSMDDPATTAVSITGWTQSAAGEITVQGDALDAADRLTLGFTDGSITAYNPTGPNAPYNSGNDVFVDSWADAAIEFHSSHLSGRTLIGISALDARGVSLVDYVLPTPGQLAVIPPPPTTINGITVNSVAAGGTSIHIYGLGFHLCGGIWVYDANHLPTEPSSQVGFSAGYVRDALGGHDAFGNVSTDTEIVMASIPSSVANNLGYLVFLDNTVSPFARLCMWDNIQRRLVAAPAIVF